MTYALITGASKGIGKEMAICLAKKKYNLLLVARSQNLLQELAASLAENYKIEAHYLALDLSLASSPQNILQWIQENNFPVSVLINNAGYGLFGNFDALKLSEQQNMLQININTLVELTYLMIPVLQMQSSKKYILNVGSMAGFQSMPSVALYAASKAMVNNFTRSLAWELKDKNISVSLLAPGSVRTGFIERSGMQHMETKANRLSMSPDELAAIAIKKMFRGKREITPGFSNQFNVFMVKILPKLWIEKVVRSLYKKK